ncbi:MAG: nucleotidyl transferase AbiEii/AbiGii toxin family protein [bacterium]
MIQKIFSEKIKEYNPANEIEQENVLQEIIQHFILGSLARTDFFSKAGFHGGTHLRIFHGMNRFSEDMDFVLKKTDMNFDLSKYLNCIKEDGEHEGIKFEIIDKSRADSAVKKAFLKTDSMGKIIIIELPYNRFLSKKIKVKLEIDSNPPGGSLFETKYINFPEIAPVTTMTLESSFASKSHALFCREYIKGRDWYDFWWYLSKGTPINYFLLENALKQYGPWQDKNIKVTKEWYVKNMKIRIMEINWKMAAEDVRKFISLKSQRNIDFWSREFFCSQISSWEQKTFISPAESSGSLITI